MELAAWWPKAGTRKWFAFAGADGKFVPTDAKIGGCTVAAGSAGVRALAAVRYALDNYPEGCHRLNGAGLPASPFRALPRPGRTRGVAQPPSVHGCNQRDASGFRYSFG
jgi:hypothetical protein